MKTLLSLMATMAIFTSCGSKSSSDTPATTTTTATWSDVSTILNASCATSGCHKAGANTSTCGKFTESEALYKAAQVCTTAANTPAARLATTGSLKMPQTGTISDANKATLTNFK